MEPSSKELDMKSSKLLYFWSTHFICNFKEVSSQLSLTVSLLPLSPQHCQPEVKHFLEASWLLVVDWLEN
jgi:hypothetical protein